MATYEKPLFLKGREESRDLIKTSFKPGEIFRMRDIQTKAIQAGMRLRSTGYYQFVLTEIIKEGWVTRNSHQTYLRLEDPAQEPQAQEEPPEEEHRTFTQRIAAMEESLAIIKQNHARALRLIEALCAEWKIPDPDDPESAS